MAGGEKKREIPAPHHSGPLPGPLPTRIHPDIHADQPRLDRRPNRDCPDRPDLLRGRPVDGVSGFSKFNFLIFLKKREFGPPSLRGPPPFGAPLFLGLGLHPRGLHPLGAPPLVVQKFNIQKMAEVEIGRSRNWPKSIALVWGRGGGWLGGREGGDWEGFGRV